MPNAYIKQLTSMDGQTYIYPITRADVVCWPDGKTLENKIQELEDKSINVEDLDLDLSKYVDITTKQTISGEKTFNDNINASDIDVSGSINASNINIDNNINAGSVNVNGNINASGIDVSDNINASDINVNGNINANGTITGSMVFGAVFNDYAEYRECYELKPGLCVCECGDGKLDISKYRLQPGANIISDTFGFAIGQTNKCQTPIAVSGRVLVYPYENRDSYNPGDAVCAGPDGTISKMTREEIRKFPERIVGTVSEIPNYKYWGTNNVEVNNRIWIKVR